MAATLLTKKLMNRSLLTYTLFALSALYCSAISATNTKFTFQTDSESYLYSVIQAGENYNFKFEKPLENNTLKLKAGYHALQSVYKDSSINKKYSDRYIRERARCFVFDSDFYTYSLCFLPNDFSNQNKNRFWGFMTQVPNWKWLTTRFLLPAILAFALFFYMTRPRHLN